MLFMSMKNLSRTQKKSRGLRLVGMPTFIIKEIEKHRQLSDKIQRLPITKTLVRGRTFKEERFLLQAQYTLQKLKIYLK